jgi:hypothetical protein
MTMRKLLTRISLAATATVVALSLGSQAAFAAGTWTVTGGPGFTGSPQPGTSFMFTDTTNGKTVSCTKAMFAGTITDQSGSTNTQIGSLSSFGFSSCTGPMGLAASATAGTGTTISVSAYNATTGTVTGTLLNVSLVFTITTILGVCTASIKGIAGFSYLNSSSLLRFTTAGDALQVTSISGSCAGLFARADVITLSSGTGGLIITGSPINPISIRQP